MHDYALEAARHQWTEAVFVLLQQVAEHFADTDAPMGGEAQRPLQNGQFIEAVTSNPTVLQGEVEVSTEEASA